MAQRLPLWLPKKMYALGNIKWWWHLLGCLLFLALPVVLSPRPPEEAGYLNSPATIRDFLAHGFMLSFFYANYYFLIPKLYFTRRYVLYCACIIIFFLIICIAPSWMLGYAPWSSAMQAVHTPYVPNAQQQKMVPTTMAFVHQIKHHIYLFVTVVLFSVLLKVRGRLLATEQASHDAEILSLKNQINPHFLFNTLNGLYAMAVRDKSSATATGILKLSGLMRYVVTETGHGPVLLEKEIAYINDYIELQRMRLAVQSGLSYTVNGIIDQQKIEPLMLVPFIENAFKHGVNPDRETVINIQIDITAKALRLSVENYKTQMKLSSYAKSGVGLENTKLRLQLLYPSKHFLLIDEDDTHFRVQLTLQFL